MNIINTVAKIDLKCERCSSLGIPTPTILFGEDLFILSHRGKSLNCCKDCYLRLEQDLNLNRYEEQMKETLENFTEEADEADWWK